MTEDELLRAVLDLCRLRGVLAHHCRPARLADGTWRTPIQGDKGFPDLVIVGARGVLFRELKSQGGVFTGEQAQWFRRLTNAGQDVAAWRPSDMASGRIPREIEAIR